MIYLQLLCTRCEIQMKVHEGPTALSIYYFQSSVCLVLNNFYYCAFQFVNLFISIIYSISKPIQHVFNLSFVIFISRSLSHFLHLQCHYLTCSIFLPASWTYGIIRITVLMCLPNNYILSVSVLGVLDWLICLLSISGDFLLLCMTGELESLILKDLEIAWAVERRVLVR